MFIDLNVNHVHGKQHVECRMAGLSLFWDSIALKLGECMAAMAHFGESTSKFLYSKRLDGPESKLG